MHYIFKGNLCGFLCGDCWEPLTGTTVRLYRLAEGQNTALLAVADPNQTFHQVSEDELNEKRSRLLAETTADAKGDFTFQLGEGYSGEAFEIDFVCGTSFGKPKPPKRDQTFQFHITTLQPQWREKDDENQTRFSYYAWRYCIAAKWWCWILKLIDRWVICGTVTDCETGRAIEGVKVLAFDVDLLEDDPLGFAYTGAGGHFRIVYTSDDFSKTIFSWLNVEWPAGPDLYFRVESASGQVLLQEPRHTGHRQDRQNAHNCFCVRLCIKDFIPVDTPWFTHVGNYNITSDINASGFTLNNRSTYGPAGTGLGFYGNVKLAGYATKSVPSAPTMPLFYRFLFSTDGTTFNPITETQMTQARLKVGVRQIIWAGITAFQDIVIDPAQTASVADSIPPDGAPGAIPDHVLRLDANGWVRVDQAGLDNGFYGPLLWLNTATIVPGGNATSAGDTAGNAPATPRNGHIVHIAFETTDDPANPTSPNLNRQTVQAHIYVNNWNEVNLLVLDELTTGGVSGCNPISTHANVHFTADHELMAAWGLSVSSAAVPGGITINTPGTSGTGPRGNNLSLDFATAGAVTPAFSTWPSCAYRLGLSVRRKLTDGEANDWGWTREIIFCK